MKKCVSWAIALVWLVLAATGCRSGGGGGEGDSAAAGELEPVTLAIVLPGERPAGMDDVIAEAERRMAGSLNVKLDVSFVPWSELASRTQVMLASGDDVDLIFDAPWVHLSQMIAAGYYEPLEELLSRYGQEAAAVRPGQMFAANKFLGRIYALPLGNSFLDGRTYVVRQDIREKLGVPPIRTYDDLIAFAYKVKESGANVAPLLTSGQPVAKDQSWAAFRAFMTYDPELLRSDALGQSIMLYYKNNDGTVYNLFDEMEPSVWSWIEEARRLYTDGLIHPDILAIKDVNAVFEAGDAAVLATNGFGVPTRMGTALAANVPGARAEAVTFMSMREGEATTNFKQANFLAVPRTSKHKERAMMFLNWTARQDNYDLLAYGIEGRDYEQAGDGAYRPLPGGRYGYFPYAWVWNPTLDRKNADLDPEAAARVAFYDAATNLRASILTGFSFDPAPVANEIALYGAIEDNYYSALFNGVEDPTATWNAFKAEGAGYLKVIQVELQKQIDAFLQR